MLRNSTVLVLVFTIIGITCVETMNGQHFHRLEGYIFETPDASKAIYKTTSKLQCAQKCFVNSCEYFTYISSEQQCQYFHIWKENVTLKKINNGISESFIASKEKSWTKVYSLSMEKDCLIYSSFMEDPRLNNTPNHCSILNETLFYRSPLINTWKYLPIDQVKFVVYKDGKEEVELVFNGCQSTKTDWFNITRLISSPWTDLSEATSLYCNIEGYHSRRRFYITKYHNSCTRDKGWLSVGEKSRCSWETSEHQPTVIYSPLSNAVNWDSGGKRGDAVAIFIKLI